MESRRNFLKLTAAGIIATGASSLSGAAAVKGNGSVAESFALGMAGYTFREFSVEQTIEMMKKVRITFLSVKDFHMPMNSTKQQIDAVINKFKNAGITVYTVGVVYMKSKEAVDQAFEYAKMAGVRMIVGAPEYDLLPYVEKKVKEYDFKLAIHNHGPDNPLFPNPTDIWDHVKNLDQRMGICIDIGHTVRDGADPAADIVKYGKRIYDVHIKDVTKSTKDGETVEIGRGIIDIQAVIAALRKINYSGKCSLEFEKDMKDPLAGIAESLGFFKGVMSCR
ncbi:MAG: TIM barrel protein [Bacteroidales bacterium]|nr:TIM barrel protein [Bacteroidales bacterium]